uniref:Uncharacterized protein n=1 Tax=Magnetococcus massalia (strain MO-1) TaxID=451514 RepID=A0A1S7LJ95_MAGMO|nr:protein of unknown function [Candidatus Magnetococcus massalia]
MSDKLGSHGAAYCEVGVAADRETGQYQNNRAENSHQQVPQLRRFNSPGKLGYFMKESRYAAGDPMTQIERLFSPFRALFHPFLSAKLRRSARHSSAAVVRGYHG